MSWRTWSSLHPNECIKNTCVEQFSQKTNWKLSEEFLHNQSGEKDSHRWDLKKKKGHQDGIGTLGRDL